MAICHKKSTAWPKGLERCIDGKRDGHGLGLKPSRVIPFCP